MGIAIAIMILLLVAVETTHRRTARLLRERMAIIERENVHLAGGIVAAKKSGIDGLADLRRELAGHIEELMSRIIGIDQRLLTLENKQPKITAKPAKVNWRKFRDTIERSTEPEEAE